MSIFKDTFKDYVKEQITARETLLDTRDTRPIEFQQYVSGKSPWARMVSFVDYKDSNDLAKTHVLYGGALYNIPSNTSTNKDDNPNLTRLRSNIAVKGGAYGSELGTFEYGIRPMPGIESISSRSMSAYGSLRETTVKYYAWDLKQLESLNILYMKPGYPVLVEWGWSLYLKDALSISTDFVHIDVFRNDVNIEVIYEKIKQYTRKHKGNYDANLGFIKNYSYTLLPNGGFECTTTIISMGDVINSLKINGGIAEISSQEDNNTNSDRSNDEFCKLLTDIGNQSVSYPDYENVRNSFPIRKSGESTSATTYSDLTKHVLLGDSGKTDVLPGGDVRYTKFINFGYFIHILNNYTSLFYSNGSVPSNLVSIELPFPEIQSNIGNGYCVSSVNAMSINNDVCFIANSEVQVLRGVPTNTASGLPTVDKFIPKVRFPERMNSNELIQFYYKDPINLGVIGNIYVNIGYLISTYISMQPSGNGTVLLGAYLKKILKDIEFTLGSVNDFDIFTIDNKAVIIDKHYVEPMNNTNYQNKFELSIMGTRTTVREHQVISKIFEEQSAMIAIAAQNRENVASIQSSTNVELNKNIYNRLYKSTSNRKTQDPDATTNTSVYRNTLKLCSFISSYIIPGKRPVYGDTTLSALNSFLNQLIVIGDGGTDYKAIVPITLQVKMDGLSGITIGEIFRIKANILPTEYRDKSVGFIVTRVNHEVNRHDWITTIESQFCLLDQKERYTATRNKSDEFLTNFNLEIGKNKIENIQALHYYNMLISLLSDFFNSDFIVSNSLYPTALNLSYDDSDSYLSRTEAQLKTYLFTYELSYNHALGALLSEIEFLTIQGITNGNSAFKIRPRLSAEELSSTPLSNFLHYYEGSIQSPNYSGLASPNTNIPLIPPDYVDFKKQNSVDYINYVIKNNSYYVYLNNYPKIQQMFDAVLDTAISKYLDKTSDFTKYYNVIENAINLGTGVTFSNYENLVIELYNSLVNISTAGVLSSKYINPNSIDQYGNINPEVMFLDNGIGIDFTLY